MVVCLTHLILVALCYGTLGLAHAFKVLPVCRARTNFFDRSLGVARVCSWHTRVLDTQNDAEFVAAVAIRTAAFMDEGTLTGPGSRAAFDHKVRHVPNFRQ